MNTSASDLSTSGSGVAATGATQSSSSNTISGHVNVVENLPDITNSTSVSQANLSSPATNQQLTASTLSTQSQPQQSSLIRSSTSPNQQSQQSSNVHGNMNQNLSHQNQQQHHQANQFGGSHSTGGHQMHQPTGNYYQRHPHAHHNQQQHHHQMQHYHPSQHQHHHHHSHQQHYHHQPHHGKMNNRGGHAGGMNAGAGGGDNESNVNHVLLITVINPHYTVTCDLIHQICSNYGKVYRIVIFKKNGVQALVEFDNVESAKRAKSALYGCDIYSGCCTLRIEYAKPSRLNIHRNDNDSFDYTNPNLASGSDGHQHNAITTGSTEAPDHVPGGGNPSSIVPHHIGGSSRASSGQTIRSGNVAGGNLGGAQHFHSSHQHQHQQQHHHQTDGPVNPNYALSNSLDHNAPTGESFHQDGGFNISRGAVGMGNTSSSSGANPAAGPSYGAYMQTHHGGMYSRQDGNHNQHHHHHGRGPGHHHGAFNSTTATGGLMVGPSMHPQGTVMMVYGLQPERVNCDRLFNLFCLYGNVVRVKFLRTKEGCAMVQMGDILTVDRCVSSLNKITLFGNELQISYSKQAFLHDVIQPYTLPDGSPSFKDFMGNKNNRFKNPEVASKNRILPPSQVLHFFNAPYGITGEELTLMFKQTAGYEPVSIKIFTPKTEGSKSFSGLATFKDSAEATEALVMCNHQSMALPGSPHPHILRLCFSHPTYVRSTAQSGETRI